MDHHITRLLLVASIVALLLAGCDNDSRDANDADAAPEAGTPSALVAPERMDSEGVPGGQERDAVLETVNPGGPEIVRNDEDIGEGPAPGTESRVGPASLASDEDLEDIPLDRAAVDGAVTSENAERFEVDQVPVPETVSDVDPEDVPSPEELDAVLDGVNGAPPIVREEDGQAGEGPAPGTESGMGE